MPLFQCFIFVVNIIPISCDKAEVGCILITISESSS